MPPVDPRLRPTLPAQPSRQKIQRAAMPGVITIPSAGEVIARTATAILLIVMSFPRLMRARECSSDARASRRPAGSRDSPRDGPGRIIEDQADLTPLIGNRNDSLSVIS
jgi:hypothetical protein